MKVRILLLALFSCGAIGFAQDILSVNVQGISNDKRDSKQIDRDEAIMDAKLKAIEKAGISIESTTQVQNFQLKNDWIESKASGII